METFTQAELLLIKKAIPALRDRGPGWPAVTQDDFMRFRADLVVLENKVDAMLRVEMSKPKLHPYYERELRTSSDLLLASIPFAKDTVF